MGNGLLKSIRQHVRFTPANAIEGWQDMAGLMALLVIVGISLLEHGLGGWRFWLSISLTTAFFLLWACTTTDDLLWLRNLKVALLALIPAAFILLAISGWGAVLMFFVLSAIVMYELPPRYGYGWICGFGLFLLVVYATIWADNGGIVVAVGTFTGFLFFGSAAESQLKATAASAESKRLLEELQIAHHLLQEQSAQAEALAASEERNRIAREVHDTLGHRLTVAAVQLEAVQKLISRDPAKAESMAGTVRQQVLDGLQELRRTVATLRAPLDEDLPLATSLARLAQNFEQATNTTIQFALDDNLPTLPHSHRHALYRAAQEALTNVQKHAHANQVTLTLSHNNEWVELSIIDDGIGFDEAVKSSGFGLQGLQERAAQLGGQVSIQSQPNHGTEMIFRIPIRSILPSIDVTNAIYTGL